MALASGPGSVATRSRYSFRSLFCPHAETVILDNEWLAGYDENDTICHRGDLLVKHADMISELPCHGVIRNDPEPCFIRHNDDVTGAFPSASSTSSTAASISLSASIRLVIQVPILSISITLPTGSAAIGPTRSSGSSMVSNLSP